MPVKAPNLNNILNNTFSDDDIFDFPVKEPEEKGKSPLSEIEFAQMQDFEKHRFKEYSGSRLENLADSIMRVGILQPIILWHIDGVYKILSGYNRRNAARIAGLSKAPVIIKEGISEAEAILIMAETNLNQRSFSEMVESEKAWCLKEHFGALKCQGKRMDLVKEIEELLYSEQDSAGGRTDQKIAEEFGTNRNKIAQYIRIADLTQVLLERLDNKEITFGQAYSLSFLKPEHMEIVDSLLSEGYKINTENSSLIKEYAVNKKLTEEIIREIMQGEKTRKPRENKPKPVKLKPTIIGRFFTHGESQKDIEETITKALEAYFREMDESELRESS
ncbi:ParB N-terminal domain-containing protein [Eisenbergiella sp.]